MDLLHAVVLARQKSMEKLGMDRLVGQLFACQIRQQDGDLTVHAPIPVREELMATLGQVLDNGRPPDGVDQSHLESPQIIKQRLLACGETGALQTAKDLLGTRTCLIDLAESDERFPGDAVVVFLPDAFDPLLGIDTLQHKAGCRAYEAIRIG